MVQLLGRLPSTWASWLQLGPALALAGVLGSEPTIEILRHVVCVSWPFKRKINDYNGAGKVLLPSECIA